MCENYKQGTGNILLSKISGNWFNVQAGKLIKLEYSLAVVACKQRPSAVDVLLKLKLLKGDGDLRKPPEPPYTPQALSWRDLS